MKNQKYAIKDLELLYSKFITAKDSGDNLKFCECLDQLSRMLIWGERQDSDFFQYFIEVKALDILLEKFSKSKSKQIVIGIIGFFNILFTNLAKPENTNFLLSHHCVLSLQSIKFLALDSEIAEYYINFLKLLSRKINPQSLHLFYNKRYPTFPLIMQTTRFYNHPQNLVRTTCRNILLTCTQLPDAKMRQFINGFPFLNYYINQCNFLKEYWYIMNRIIEAEDNNYELQNLENILQDHEQILFFMEDFMKNDPEQITARFIDAFSNQCMSPLLHSLYSTTKIHFNIKISLFICNILIKIITNQRFVEYLAVCLFGNYYPSKINFKLTNPVDQPLSYSKTWKFKGFWDNHQNEITQYCLLKYFNQKQDLNNSSINGDSQPKRYTNQMRSIFGMGTNFYEREVEKLEKIFGMPINTPIQAFKRESMSSLFVNLKQSLSKQILDLSNYEQNPVRALIFSFAKSKDDQLVFLTLNLLHQVTNKKIISKQVIEFCSLTPQPSVINFKSISDIEQIIKSCLNVLETDPPTFRICTYKLAQELVINFCKIYAGDVSKIPQQLFQMAKEALRNSIERIKPYIYEQKQWETSLGFYNAVTQQDTLKKTKTLVTYGFLPPQNNKYDTLNHIYDNFPKNSHQVEARDFWLYIIIRDTYCNFTKTLNKFQVNICDEKNTQKASKFQIGSPYVIEEDHCIECKHREMHEQKYMKSSLIFLGGYIVIGQENVVKYKGTYNDTVMLVDRSDPRCLMIEIKQDTLVIAMENAKQAFDVKKRFQQMKSLMFQYQLSMLVKQTQWMLERIAND